MTAPVHITKRALAVVGGRPLGHWGGCACGGYWDGFNAVAAALVQMNPLEWRRVTCPACLVLLDAELEGRGAEAQRQRVEIEAGR